VDTLEDKVQVFEFVKYVLDNQASLNRKALFVPMTQEQTGRALNVLEGASIDAGSE
jgi:hypothetical protein